MLLMNLGILFKVTLPGVLGELEILNKSMVTGAEALRTGTKPGSSLVTNAWSVVGSFLMSGRLLFVAFTGFTHIFESMLLSSGDFVGDLLSSSFVTAIFLYSSASIPLILPERPEAILWLIPTFT